jgi:hypothetical protein
MVPEDGQIARFLGMLEYLWLFHYPSRRILTDDAYYCIFGISMESSLNLE